LQRRPIDRYPELIAEEDWMSIAADLSNITCADVRAVAVVRGGTDYEIETYTLLDPERLRDPGSWSRRFEAYRRIAAVKLYAKDPRAVQAKVRRHFEPIWASAAADVHDGMGGLPRWEGNASYFDLPIYYSRGMWEEFFSGASLPAAPFDEDNAMLLQLFSDPIMGWMWGDVSHIAFILPRSELAQANFDNTLAVIGG
jgi:hypothetical protein